MAVQSGVKDRPGQAGWPTGHCGHGGGTGVFKSHVGPFICWLRQVKYKANEQGMAKELHRLQGVPGVLIAYRVQPCVGDPLVGQVA